MTAEFSSGEDKAFPAYIRDNTLKYQENINQQVNLVTIRSSSYEKEVRKKGLMDKYVSWKRTLINNK